MRLLIGAMSLGPDSLYWHYCTCKLSINKIVLLLLFVKNYLGQVVQSISSITLSHSERPKLHTILAFLSAIGLSC